MQLSEEEKDRGDYITRRFKIFPVDKVHVNLSLVELFGEWAFFKLLNFDFPDAGEPNGEPVPLHPLDEDHASKRLSAHDRPD